MLTKIKIGAEKLQISLSKFLKTNRDCKVMREREKEREREREREREVLNKFQLNGHNIRFLTQPLNISFRLDSGNAS